MVPDTTELPAAVESATAQPELLAVSRPRRHILDFPAEILETIFRHTVMRHADDDKWQDLGHGERNLERLVAPFRLAAVCSTWRRIMLGYGALWSYICIPDPVEWEYGLQAPDFLTLMLERSGVAPLWVLLPWETPRRTMPWANYPLLLEILRRCIEALCAHSDRWLRFEFRAPMGTVAEKIMRRLLRQSTAQLKHLHVSFGPRRPSQWQPNSFYQPMKRLLPYAPKLIEADLILEHWSSSTSRMEQLVTLEVDVPAFPPQLWQLLSLTPNLEHLILEHNFHAQNARPQVVLDRSRIHERVVLEHLWKIVVGDSLSRKSHCLGVLADLAWLPNLMELDLPWGMTWLDESHMRDLAAFLREHGSRLRTITFREDRNLKWWARVPAAQRRMLMELAHEDFWTLLSERDPVSGQPCVAPALAVIRFEGLAFFPRDGMAFREFHATRCASETPGGNHRIDVLWFPESEDAENCATYDICSELFNLPWSKAEWEQLLKQGASRHRARMPYFASSRYVSGHVKDAF